MQKSLIKLIYKEDFNAAKQAIETADLSEVDSEGDTALHMAVLKGSEEIVSILLLNNSPVNAQNNMGKAPIHYAAEANYLTIAQSLIAKGANLAVTDVYGNQPLWTAVFNASDGDIEKLSFVEILLQCGADKNHKNKAGRSPLDFANQVKFIPLLQVLDKY